MCLSYLPRHGADPPEECLQPLCQGLGRPCPPKLAPAQNAKRLLDRIRNSHSVVTLCECLTDRSLLGHGSDMQEVMCCIPMAACGPDMARLPSCHACTQRELRNFLCQSAGEH